MTSTIIMFLAVAVLMLFLYAMLFIKEDNNRSYIKFVFIAYPFLGIDLLPSFISTTLFVFITFIFLVFFHQRKSTTRTGVFSYFHMFLFLLLSIAVGLFLSPDLSKDTITDFVQLLAVFFFAKVLIDEVQHDLGFRTSILHCMKITLIFSFVFLAFQFIIGPSFSFAKSQNINVAGGIAIRYPSFFQDPQKYAQYLSASSLLMLLLPGKMNGKMSQLGLLLCALSMIALLFTGGRAGLGGWLLGLLIVIFLGNAQYRAAIISVAILVSIFIYNFSDAIPIFKRDDLADAYAFRYAIWQDAFAIFQDHPFFGIGLGNYANYVSLHNPDQYWISDNEITLYDHPESGYLKLLTEFGLIGFLAAMLFIIKPIYGGIAMYFKTKDLSLVILVSSLFTWIIGFYTVYSLGDIRIKLLIVSIVCILIASSSDNYDHSKKPKIV
ncbi:MAG: O-antigen ligase family protein [Chitinophagaceae bacterium]|nr:O-antigen ligase family protein [Chitinophagaceae bacterium]